MARKLIGNADIAVENTVLLGRPGISMPADWFLGKVLWLDAEWVRVQ